MNKLKKRFFFFHLFSSLAFISVISLICQYLWFPAPFLLIDGTWFALSILATIDLIIGPLLTLLLISPKKSKSEIRADLAIILLLQISAFVYGLTKIYDERIYSLVYTNGLFHPIPVKEIGLKYKNSELNLPRYNGIYYAMIDSQQLSESKSEKHAMYSPEKYKPLTNRILKDKEVEYDSLPKNLKEHYNSNFIYKVLAGKKRSAIIVFDEKMKMLNIELGPQVASVIN
jgi:hypothetical protein